MNKTLLGIGLLILSIAGFFMWVNPHYSNVKTLKSQLADSTLALSRAEQLGAIRSRLVDQENSFAQSDLAKLQNLLPDSVDSVRLVINMQNIASRDGLVLKNIGIDGSKKTSPSNSSNSYSSGIASPSGKQYGEIQLSFSVTATYENMITFLQDLERSLQVVEVKSLSFSVDSKNPNLYTVSINVSTFLLNKSSSSVTSP